MGLIDDAMKAAAKNTATLRKQNFDGVNAVLDWINTMDALGPSVGGSGGGGVSHNAAPRMTPMQMYSGKLGGTIDGFSPGAPTTGGPRALMNWNFRGMPVTTAKGTKKYFKPFLRDLAATGYDINSLGGYANRNARGLSRKSEHYYGDAIDINPEQNPMTSAGRLITNLPPNIAKLAALHHLIWGGTWHSRKDPMHFSITGY